MLNINLKKSQKLNEHSEHVELEKQAKKVDKMLISLSLENLKELNNIIESKTIGN